MDDSNEESEYYRRRASAARGLAGIAADPRIREIHLDLARRYMVLADAAEATG